MYILQRYIALNTDIGITVVGEEWVARIVVMTLLSVTWISAITYIARLLWRWSKAVIGHINVSGRATYKNVRASAPRLIEDSKNTYQAHIWTKAAPRADDKAFEIAGNEIKINRPIEALWAKVLMLADGDSERAKSKYIRLRVEQIVKLRRRK